MGGRPRRHSLKAWTRPLLYRSGAKMGLQFLAQVFVTGTARRNPEGGMVCRGTQKRCGSGGSKSQPASWRRSFKLMGVVAALIDLGVVSLQTAVGKSLFSICALVSLRRIYINRKLCLRGAADPKKCLEQSSSICVMLCNEIGYLIIFLTTTLQMKIF